MSSSSGSAILGTNSMPAGPMPTLDPFLFCVYHKDQYPPGNPELEAPQRGDGMHFDPSAEYRMYHGTMVPGFPQHPHRGFETITATMDGIIDHADSFGNAGRYGMGDVQWMTAGKGCVHSEMFPLLKQSADNPTRFFQIWLNLPARNKMVEPGFSMFWADEVPRWQSDDKKASVTLWAGTEYFDVATNNAPPENSWASDPENDVAIFHIVIRPGGSLTLPKARVEGVNRNLYYIEGDSKTMQVDGQEIREKVILTIKADQEVTLEMDEKASGSGEFLMLQGKPIEEPVVQHGPFVMNTRDEIQQAFMDYQITQFGGWPWPRDDMVFPKDKGRFALINGTETEPADAACIE